MKHFLVYVFLLVSVPVLGQDNGRRMDIGLYSNYSFYIDKPYEKRQNTKFYPCAGMKFNYALRNNFGFHFMASYTPQRLRFIHTVDNSGSYYPPFVNHYIVDHYILQREGIFGAGIFFGIGNADTAAYDSQKVRLVNKVFVRTGLLAANLKYIEYQSYNYDREKRYWGAYSYSYFYTYSRGLYPGLFVDLTVPFNLSKRFHIDLSLPLTLLIGVGKSFDPSLTIGYRF